MTRVRLVRARQQIGATRDETRLAGHSQIAGVEGSAVVRPVVSTGAVVFLTLFPAQPLFVALLVLFLPTLALVTLALAALLAVTVFAAPAVVAVLATPVPVILASHGQRRNGCQLDAGQDHAAKEAEH